MRLKDKVALITGAARGIGAAIASAFVEEGAFVVVSDVNHELGQQVVERLGSSALYIPLDVSKRDGWERAARVIAEQGLAMNVLVNNAGISGFEGGSAPMNPEECSLEDWDRIHEVNLKGTFLGCQYGIRWMKGRGGSIINLSSRSGVVGVPALAPYASSKAGIRNHTKTVALYCAENNYGIRCNSILPATILTPMWELMLGEGEAKEGAMRKIEEGIPLHQFGKPMDVAYAAIYLASDESAYMTGSEIYIDGGILAGASAAPKKAAD
ncbi:MAG: 3-beta-hydroxysteroid dehydrogenase [Chlamydiae bacterium]|nr:3-beta-hydroxysteroid dehydrogenase [Chlamydiota bacterium]